MGKKKHAEHVNHERWLVSYADLLTLLFAFFVVLFASSVSDKKKTTQMAAAMQTAFTQHGVFDAHAATPPLAEGAGNSQGMPMPLMLPVQTAPAGDASAKNAAGLQNELRNDAGKAVDPGSITVSNTSEGMTISLHEAGFFSSGSADLQPATLPLLDKLAAKLPDGDLRIEGHTDNVPIHTERFSSNWELSTARAAAIANVLMHRSRIAPAHFSLAGYGQFRPVQGNNTAEGRAQNRRVDIVVLASRQTAKTVEFVASAAGNQRAPAPAGLMGVSASMQQSTHSGPVPLAQQLIGPKN